MSLDEIKAFIDLATEHRIPFRAALDCLLRRMRRPGFSDEELRNKFEVAYLNAGLRCDEQRGRGV